MDSETRWCGLLARRTRWSLSWKGWLATILGLTAAVALGLTQIHPFLAVTDRLETDALVVEGWIPLTAIRGAATEITNGGYARVFTTGGPVHGSGPYQTDYSTSASIGAGNLRKAGVRAELIQMVPSKVRDRDRTYSSAVALRNWLRENHLAVQRLNVVTEGVHARRTRLLFQKAFGEETRIGVISIPSQEYPAARWWKYSEGIKDIISEGAAYLYARIFFVRTSERAPGILPGSPLSPTSDVTRGEKTRQDAGGTLARRRTPL